MLDTIRPLSFEFHDRSIPGAQYDAIAWPLRMTSADPTLDLQAHVPRTQLDAAGERQSASYPDARAPFVPSVSISGRAAAARTCSAQMRIRGCYLEAGLHFQIASISTPTPTVVLRNGLADRHPSRSFSSIAACADWTPASRIWPALLRLHTFPRRQSLRRSTLYDMHRDHPYCLPPAPAFCSCKTPNAMYSASTKRLPTCFACPVPMFLPSRPGPRAPQIGKQPFLVPGSAFHLRQLLSTAHAKFVASPRVVPSSAPSQPSAATCPWYEPRTTNMTHTPCTSPTHALRVSAPPSAQSQVLSRTTTSVHSTLSITHATFVPSHLPRSSPLTARLPCLHVFLRCPVTPACTADIPYRPRCTHRTLITVPTLSAVPPPATHASCMQHEDSRTRLRRCPLLEQQLRCAQESRFCCALSLSARRLQLPHENPDSSQARAMEGGRVTYCGIAGEVLNSVSGYWHSLHASEYVVTKTMLGRLTLNFSGDRPDMAHCVESRVPFLDHHLVQYVSGLPPSVKIRPIVVDLPGKLTLVKKWILRQAVKPFVTDEIYRRKKVQFNPPLSGRPAVVSDLVPLQIHLKARITQASVEKLRFVDWPFIKGLLADYLKLLIFPAPGAIDGRARILWIILGYSVLQEHFHVPPYKL
ncbi:hypothetical protein K438DRAFT_1990828 [Mycena galopus ATCC 62051]|nr:hypothetical protein K438DRAFT_1990828 [Mycena galopus ATCC 62051]